VRNFGKAKHEVSSMEMISSVFKEQCRLKGITPLEI